MGSTGAAWSLLLGQTLILSVLLIHNSREDGDPQGTRLIDETRQETLQYWHACKSKFGNNISVIAGFDANVTLPVGIPGITGHSILSPLSSHSVVMQQRVIGWMAALGIRAISTFGDDQCASELWTGGIKRKPVARSRIDYIGASANLSGVGKALNWFDLKHEQPLISGMDHRPVMSMLEWAVHSAASEQGETSLGLPKRALRDEQMRRRLHNYVTAVEWQSLDLQNYELALREVASACYGLEA